MKAIILNTTPETASLNSLLPENGQSILGDERRLLKLVEIDEPKIPHPKYVKIKTRLAGVCGTDLSVIDFHKSQQKGKNTNRDHPVNNSNAVLGHEIVGEVVEIGPQVKRFRIGDRLTVADDKVCDIFELPSCPFCKANLPTLCVNKHKRKIFKNIGGGWSEYLVRHENQLFLIPTTMTDDLAVLMEPASASLHAVLRSPPKENDEILVIGGGTIGLGVVCAIKALNTNNAKVTVLARHKYQRDKALSLGADNVVDEIDTYRQLADVLTTEVLGRTSDQILNYGFDRIYDCVFSSETFNNGLRWLRPRGKLIVVGTNKILDNIDATPAWQRELTIIGTHGYAHDTWEGVKQHTVERCINWASTDRLKEIGSLLTHKFPLSLFNDAIDTASSHQTTRDWDEEVKGPIKVAFDFTEFA